MDTLKMHTPNLTAENIEKLMELFPNCITEAKDEKTGNVKRAIDFDQLRQELSDHIVDGPRERYHIDWPGKREALLAANAPIAKTLRPCREESVDFDTTNHLFIEGDNLDALKLLQETYLGKVKLIYIDPPYNTGKDFVYKDSFADDTQTYLLDSNQRNYAGNKLVANTESNGRFHSDWMKNLYARLRLAKNLLKPDGVIFISIDDHEIGNLRKIADEVFGEQNFVAQVVWEKMYTTKNDSALLSQCHEYALVYARDITTDPIGLLPRTPEMDARYTNPDNDPRGPWKAIPLYAKGERKNGRYKVVSPTTGREHVPGPDSHWLYSEADTKAMIEDNRISFGKDGNALPNVKRFLSEVQQGTKCRTLWKHNEVGSNDSAKRELRELYGQANIPFDFPKPITLIRRMIQLSIPQQQNEIIMDFYAGSGTTGHSVLMHNRDGARCRYILVQIQEKIDVEKKEQRIAAEYCDSIGRPRLVSELTKDRLRKVGAELKANPSTNALNLDVGFRVLKIDTSNMKDVYYAPDAVEQSDLLEHTDNIKSDRTPEDLLFQVLVDWGVDLALPIEQQTIAGKTVFFVAGNALAACFDARISEDLVKELAKRKPLRAVFRDSSYASDSTKINVEQIFKLLSPETEVKSL